MKVRLRQMPYCKLHRKNAYDTIEEPLRRNNKLNVFLTNNDQLTRRIIITKIYRPVAHTSHSMRMLGKKLQRIFTIPRNAPRNKP